MNQSTPLKKLLSNPIVGFAPWIFMTVITGPGRLEIAVVASLATALLLGVLGVVAGMRPKMLDLAGILYFGALLVVGLLVNQGGTEWLEKWGGELSNIMLVVIAVGSMLVREPFTIQYARESVPKEFWDTPRFMHTNMVITGAWAIAFIVSAVAGYIGDGPLDEPNNLWTGWLIQIGAIIAAIQFTQWYPDVAEARGRGEQGIAGDPAPGIDELLIPLTAYIVPVGIVLLVANEGPWWVGVGLIAVGSALTKQLQGGAEPARSS